MGDVIEVTGEISEEVEIMAKAKGVTLVKDGQTIKVENITGVTEFKLGQDASIKVKATNLVDREQDATLVVGLFDDNNRLVNYVAVSKKLSSKEEVVLSARMRLPQSGNYKLKAFVWDNIDTMNSISKTLEFSVK